MATARIKHFDDGGTTGDVDFDGTGTPSVDNIDPNAGTVDTGNVEDPGGVLSPVALTQADYDAAAAGDQAALDKVLNSGDAGVVTNFLNMFKGANGSIDWTKLLKIAGPALGGVAGLVSNMNNTGGAAGASGYQGGIPSLTASRQMNAIPEHRPGQGGITYFSPMQYLGQQNMPAGPAGGTAPSPGANGAPATNQYTNGSTGTGTNPATMGSSGTGQVPPGKAAGIDTLPGTGAGDGMWVNGKFITKSELQNAFKTGTDPVQYLQQNGITNQDQIHNLVVQAEQIAGNAPTGEDAVKNAFKTYQQYNPNGKYANDYDRWKNDQDPTHLNAMRAGIYTGAVTSPSDFEPGGIYGPGSVYYGQAGYASGLGPRGMGDMGGGWNTPGQATGSTSQLSAAQQQQLMAAGSQGTPLPTINRPPAVSSSEISGYYQQHANDPAALKAAMAQYGVTPEQAAAATGQNVSAFQFARGGGVQGGIAALAAHKGRLLQGPGDGVSDSIPAVIGHSQPARLADGEFVVPARAVSELGNGSTAAGSRKLYAMLDRIEKTRTKNKVASKDSHADRHLPA